MDRILSFPKDLQLDKNALVHLYDYNVTKSTFNNKIDLTSNVISFLVEGKKTFLSSQSSLTIDNNHFLIIKSGNCLMTERISEASNAYKSILLFFSDDLAAKILNKYSTEINNDEFKPSIKSCEYDNYTRALVKSLVDILTLSKEVQKKMLPLKLEELIVYLVETKGRNFLHFLTSRDALKTRNFIDTIEANKLNKLNLKELSFLSNMSVSTFKREFEKHFNQSPIKWFQNQRLEHAAILLKKEVVRPSDIYEEIGYETLSNFIYAFKNKYEVTPKQYQLK